ncbi:FMN-binding glutamate synthase family protein [Legionella septentrionalis]|uniref:FMN-binding glutamate synthase family protein n=1 Tax=Legionella septentrionalis TaxID=2498109 RepID=A0A433JJB6_9GAMM|nr:FMN-binding glutamate synthase family protein [Legionella septentrionalis]RUR02501.1 FMN-binding glutamate synthase family protein [Legionella septentrionalis]RUR10385.1 FMN-binding glutamate synthase family protein [Legionella septentrionalis]RUR17179.1 FMN-binding glutamate synthase family protein [Legionella septentrionalis]
MFFLRAWELGELIWLIISVSTLLFLISLYLYDRNQKKRTILRNYPVIGHFRYVGEYLGEFFRQYFFAGDREELPFNRAERNWVYRASKNVDTTLGFGSTRPLNNTGTVYFVNAPFPPLATDKAHIRAVTIGPFCAKPYTTTHFFNISAMSYGAISKPAIQALGRGAKMAGCWLNTGEGGIAPYHLESGCDIVAQIGTAKYGFRDLDGKLSDKKLREYAQIDCIKMFEIKLSQGAKPGKGGILPAIKVTEEIAKIRGIPVHVDSISPSRHIDISNVEELLDVINHVREITGKPVGCKFVLGSYDWLHELCQTIHKRGIPCAPDFITLDSADGGTGASPQGLMDYMGIPIDESLPKLVDFLVLYHLRERIKVIASGKLITPAEVTWALCAGADFINSARGFMLALGCVQSMKCHRNTCPTGIATHNKHLQRGLVVEDKAERVYHYANNMVDEVAILCHSCGVDEPRQLKRSHARIVREDGFSVSLAEIFPDQEPLAQYKSLSHSYP